MAWEVTLFQLQFPNMSNWGNYVTATPLLPIPDNDDGDAKRSKPPFERQTDRTWTGIRRFRERLREGGGWISDSRTFVNDRFVQNRSLAGSTNIFGQNCICPFSELLVLETVPKLLLKPNLHRSNCSSWGPYLKSTVTVTKFLFKGNFPIPENTDNLVIEVYLEQKFRYKATIRNILG